MKKTVLTIVSNILFLTSTWTHATWKTLYTTHQIHYAIDPASKVILDSTQNLISIEIRKTTANKEKNLKVPFVEYATINTYLISCKNYQYALIATRKITDKEPPYQYFTLQNSVLKLKIFHPKKNILLSKIRTESCKIQPKVKAKLKPITAS